MGQRRIWIAIVTPQQRSDDATDVHSVVFKERTIFGNRNRLYQVRRQVIKANHSSLGAFASGYRADQFGLELSSVQMCALAIRDPGYRFSAACKLNSQRVERSPPVNNRIL